MDECVCAPCLACRTPHASPSSLPPPPAPPLLQAAGLAKDVAAFAERWVYGRGCPRIIAGFTYTKKTNTLVVGPGGVLLVAGGGGQ